MNIHKYKYYDIRTRCINMQVLKLTNIYLQYSFFTRYKILSSDIRGPTFFSSLHMLFGIVIFIP